MEKTKTLKKTMGNMAIRLVKDMNKKRAIKSRTETEPKPTYRNYEEREH